MKFNNLSFFKKQSKKEELQSGNEDESSSEQTHSLGKFENFSTLKNKATLAITLYLSFWSQRYVKIKHYD